MNVIFLSNREGRARQLNLRRPLTLSLLAGLVLLVLGSAGCAPDGIGPVARAWLGHAPCAVVVVSVALRGVPVPA